MIFMGLKSLELSRTLPLMQSSHIFHGASMKHSWCHGIFIYYSPNTNRRPPYDNFMTTDFMAVSL